MAITYGFFNSVNGDRTYDADQMSEYFDGLVSNGVYESVGGALQVMAVSSGMAVQVLTGRGLINCKWLNNDAVLTLDLTAAHAVLNRYTAVVMRLDIVNRLMTITTKDGANATDPVKPTMQNDGTAIELCLAYIYVGAGVTSISQANIEDMRASSSCGWVTGLITQVDTSTLFLQYQTAYQNMLNTMESWQAQMQSDFEDWYEALTDDLNVNTYIQKFYKRTVLASGTSNIIPMNITGYTYDSSDIISIYINGLYAAPNVDYYLDTSGSVPQLHPNASAAGTEVLIVVLKSKIGFNTLTDSNGNNIVTQGGNNIEV